MLRESLLCSSPLALQTKLDRQLAIAVWGDETLTFNELDGLLSNLSDRVGESSEEAP
jgi:hypothetical protein